MLDFFLVSDAEALFLVDNEQPQIAELDILREQSVRADDDVHFARGKVRDDLLLLLLRPEAAEHLDTDGEPGEAILQGLLMLERQHRRRRQKRHLLRVHDRFEGGAHGDFCFAVADVATEQAVHRRRRFHVALDVGDGAFLIGRQLVLEGVFEFLLPV